MTEIAKVDQGAECLVRVWDKDFNFVSDVTHGWRLDEPGVIVVPAESTVGSAILGYGMVANVHLTVDHPRQTRWCGRIDRMDVTAPFGADRYIRANFHSDAYSFKVLDDVAEWIRAQEESRHTPM